jgi:T4 RnlA family RNA ligase
MMLKNLNLSDSALQLLKQTKEKTMTSIFPFLCNDTAIREALSDREEIRFMTQPNGTSVCCYMVSGPDTFRDGFSREARGSVFSDSGTTIARPLHKFFNVNQMPHTLVDVIDWSQVVRVMDKRDGSMIHTVDFPSDLGTFTLKSKKSYTSDVAIQATRFMMNSKKGYIDLCEFLVAKGMTAIFEWTSPTARIVLAYAEDNMTLLHIRDNVTGEYLTREQLIQLCAQFDIPFVDHRDDIMELIKSDPKGAVQKLYDETEGVEGWVMQFQNGDMVKLKTKWYMDRHHAMTFLRTRDIARMVIDESLDDLIAKLVGDGINVDQIRDIESRVVVEINKIEKDIDALFSTTVGQDRKTVAMTNNGHKYFGMLMQKFSGKEPDVKAYFEKNMLDQMFDLTQLNLVDSVAETDE